MDDHTLSQLGWLALEVKYLEPAKEFYQEHLDLNVLEETGNEVTFEAGNTEFDFGNMKSLYFYDRDRHCVELGQRNITGEGITGIFEIVLEVEDLRSAEEFYTLLGGEVTSRGDDRKRVRLDLGCVDFELWEPQLGIADAQGGVHVDVGFETTGNPRRVVEAIEDRALTVEKTDGGIRVKDPDGHYLTFF
ncbi:MAG: fosmidomycin resistance protein [Halobacteria archaeon]|nr:fosmidomycin resistance protein [Halobacteria archaeon]